MNGGHIQRSEGIVIYEMEDFLVYAPKHPHVSREEGGHIMIEAKREGCQTRLDFFPREAIEMIRLTMLTGEAMKMGMLDRGVKIELINYQENGNWIPAQPKYPLIFHSHLYGRTRDSKIQTWGEALVFPPKSSGFYEHMQGLDADDVAAIQKHWHNLEMELKYRPESWHLRNGYSSLISHR